MMKTTRQADRKAKNYHKIIMDFFDKEEICSIIGTLAGCANLLADFVVENHDAKELNSATRYSFCLLFNTINLLRSVLKGEAKREELTIEHMPTHDNAWQSEDDFEKRLIFMIQKIYEELKKEGKLL